MSIRILEPFITQTAFKVLSAKNHKFSDRDIAAIIFHSPSTCKEKIKALKKLATNTNDKALTHEIEQSIEYHTKCYDAFVKNKGGFYQLNVAGQPIGTCTSIEEAYNFAVKAQDKFEIQKQLIPGEPPVSGCCYTPEGYVTYMWSEEVSPHEETFEKRFVKVPAIFNAGDIVTYDTHIAMVITSVEEWDAFLKKVETNNLNVDFYDTSITVSFFTEKMSEFSHDHICPLFLEASSKQEIDKLFKKRLHNLKSRKEESYDIPIHRSTNSSNYQS